MSADNLSRIGLSLLLLSLLVGCEQSIESRFSPALFPQKFEEYKEMPHYRALATGYVDRWNSIFFVAVGHENAIEAIDAAYEGCDLELEEEGRDWGCSLFAIGDIDVRDLTQEQFQQAIELYEDSTSATNADLENGTD
jgi:hypothetical protein